jgi:hypothetical protein
MAVTSKNATAAPLLKNAAAAPMIYFDGSPVHGTLAGHIEVELAARILMPKADGGVAADMVCVAHLRCSPQAAQSLIDALTHSLQMLTSSSHQSEDGERTLNS